jgi:hypothetical protein
MAKKHPPGSALNADSDPCVQITLLIFTKVNFENSVVPF